MKEARKKLGSCWILTFPSSAQGHFRTRIKESKTRGTELTSQATPLLFVCRSETATFIHSHLFLALTLVYILCTSFGLFFVVVVALTSVYHGFLSPEWV